MIGADFTVADLLIGSALSFDRRVFPADDTLDAYISAAGIGP
ncbi:hypothetical protein WBP07_22280 (plasmid) [Novosphingobium sp. BL-8A]